MKRIFATGILLLVSSFVNAEQLIFSQYDGVNTWHNVYVEVNSAKDYVRPGVAYTPASNGKSTNRVSAVSYSPAYISMDEPTGSRWEFTAIEGSTDWTWLSDGTDDYGTLGNVTVQGLVNDTENDVLVNRTGVEATAGTEAQYEDNHPARSIISVPTGIDMELFIKEFMENR